MQSLALQVVEALQRKGIGAHYEYPGFISIALLNCSDVLAIGIDGSYWSGDRWSSDFDHLGWVDIGLSSNTDPNTVASRIVEILKQEDM